MTIYILNILIILVLGFLFYSFKFTNYRDSIFLCFAFIQLFLISGMRYEIGIDFINYRGTFRLVQNLSNLSELLDFSKVTNLEIGYLLLNKIVGFFTVNPQWIFIISSLIILVFIFISIKNYSSNVWLSVYLFSVGQYLYSFNVVRQFIAVSLIFYSYKFIKERKFIKYLLFIAIASTFHISALILLPLYFILNINFNKKKMLIAAFIGAIIVIFFDQIISIIQLFLYSNYKKGTFGVSNGNFGNLVISFIYFFTAMLFKSDLLKRDKDNKFLINWSFINFVLSIMSMKLWIITRLMIYSGIFMILLIPEVICSIKNKNNKIIVGLLFIILTFVLYIKTILNPVNKLLPYHFFW